MKKIILFALIIFCSVSIFAQHTVNDINQYGGWYKITVDIGESGKAFYFITQCYPSGEEFDVVGTEREKLPLSLKILCMGFGEELKEGLDIHGLSFEEEGFSLKVTNLSLSFVLKYSMSEDELLEELGTEAVDEYRNRKWP